MQNPHTAIARSRHYLAVVAKRGIGNVSRHCLAQAVLCIPALLKHIDAQASMLGHPRNRTDETEAVPAMHGEHDTYDPPPRTSPHSDG